MALGFFRLNGTPPLAPFGVYRYRLQSASANYDEYLEWQVDSGGTATIHASSGAIIGTNNFAGETLLQPSAANDYVLTMYNMSPLTNNVLVNFNACQIPDLCWPSDQCGAQGYKMSNKTDPTEPKAYFNNLLNSQQSISVSNLKIFDRPDYNIRCNLSENESLDTKGTGGFSTFESPIVGINPICGPHQTNYGNGIETTVPLGSKFYRQLLDPNSDTVYDNNNFIAGYISAFVDLSCPQPCTAPTITTQPINISSCNLSNGTLSVIATGTAPINYQWKLNGSDIPTETNSSINVSADGSYTVVVTNSCGSVTSNAATLTTNTSPSGGGSQTAINITVGTPYSKIITYSGTAPLSISAITKPSWLNITLLGNIVTISGTPGAGDVGSSDYSFIISNLCGSQTTSATGGLVTAGCTAIGAGTINGNTNVTVDVNENYNITGLSGTAPFTYTWSVTNAVIISGQGTSEVIVKPTSGGSTVQCTIKNCSNTGSVILSKTLNTKINCTPTLHLKPTCFTVASMTGTLSGITEPSRIISFTSSTVTFTAAIGTHNYTFLLTDTNRVVHTVTFKNITC